MSYAIAIQADIVTACAASKNGTRGRIQTGDLSFRKRPLYPAELREQLADTADEDGHTCVAEPL